MRRKLLFEKHVLFVLALITTQFCFITICKGQNVNSDQIEILPQLSLHTFTANSKLVGKAYGGEITYHIGQQNSPKTWMKAMGVNAIDIIYNYKRMENIQLDYYPYDGIFADSHALLAGLNLRMFNLGKLKVQLAPAVGLTYVGETYETNRNPVTSSHVNVALRGALKLALPLNPKTQLTAGIDIFHYSNGAYKVANNGMNLSSIGLGISRSLRTRERQFEEIVYDTTQKSKHSLDIGLDIGRRGIFRSKKGVFRNGLYLGYSYRLSQIFALSSGVDAVYYHTVFDPNKYFTTHQSFGSSYDRLRVGLGIGGDIWMGKLAAMFRTGYYVHYNSFTDTKTYWTSGLRYNISNRFSLQAKIYLHGTEADYLGFGFIFNPGLFKI